MAKNVFQAKRKLFTGKMNLELKKRIVKCLVRHVGTYAIWFIVFASASILSALSESIDTLKFAILLTYLHDAN